jgi:hypothetical protein
MRAWVAVITALAVALAGFGVLADTTLAQSNGPRRVVLDVEATYGANGVMPGDNVHIDVRQNKRWVSLDGITFSLTASFQDGDDLFTRVIIMDQDMEIEISPDRSRWIGQQPDSKINPMTPVTVSGRSLSITDTTGAMGGTASAFRWQGQISGYGTCNQDGDCDLSFEISGQASGQGQCSGQMTMAYEAKVLFSDAGYVWKSQPVEAGSPHGKGTFSVSPAVYRFGLECWTSGTNNAT